MKYPHGTTSAYTVGCRCPECRAENTAAAAERRAGIRRGRGGRTHGKCSTYNAGCRCAECRRADTERKRAYRARTGGARSR